ncbi:MAG: MBL fold metallo-hydrolase [Planctomycetota bacterium]|jgi:glyoxylase-like metal-dependent hydrolase (beta-lactamase superfamily II)
MMAPGRAATSGSRRFVLSAALLVGLGLVATARAQDATQIVPTQVAEGIYLLEGRGGNMAVSVGSDGAFLVDTQFAPLHDKIREAVAELGPGAVRFVLNTHWHGDHVGGNEPFGKKGAVIVAHVNVRERMSTEQFMEAFQRKVEPSPPKALPVVTFREGIDFRWNGQTIDVRHVPQAHTDGDSIVRFVEANVLHMGDCFFNGKYPFIDLSSGGSIDGAIAACTIAIELCDDETKVIPGHGALSNRAELKRYVEVLTTIRARVAKAIEAGKDVEAVIKERPTREWDEAWGNGFIKPDTFVRIVYQSLTRHAKK